MNEKWEAAISMVDEGCTNDEILNALKREYGSGISTRQLADWRATTMDRAAERVRSEKLSRKQEKVEFIKSKIREGLSPHQIQKACKATFGKSTGYDTINRYRAEMELEGEPTRAASADTDIVPVELPPEVREDETEETPEETSLTTTVPPPNGSLTDIKAVQSWMKKINAKSLTLNEAGDLSVIVEHNFNIGAAE